MSNDRPNRGCMCSDMTTYRSRCMRYSAGNNYCHACTALGQMRHVCKARTAWHAQSASMVICGAIDHSHQYVGAALSCHPLQRVTRQASHQYVCSKLHILLTSCTSSVLFSLKAAPLTRQWVSDSGSICCGLCTWQTPASNPCVRRQPTWIGWH